MTPDAILFDLDGTLVDSIDLIVHAYQTTVERHLNVALPREEIVPLIGRSLFDLFEEMAPGRSQELVASYRVYMHSVHDEMIRGFDGVDAMLDALAERGMPIGIVTSKSLASATPSLARFGLTPRMRTIVTLDDTDRHKPHPAPLLKGAERLGLDPSRLWYVGDSVHDLAAARSAGMRAVAAGWGPTSHDELRPLADDLLATPEALIRLLRGASTRAD